VSCGPVREGMKTIRQIADEIGVSKTAVNKQIANLGLRSGLRKNGNQFAIDEHQEALIKQAFSEKSQTEIENQSQTKTQTENHEVGDLVCVLQATIDTLQGQLEVKDRQIAKLTEALVAAQQTAAAAQALHAGTMKQQLLSGESGADQHLPEQFRPLVEKARELLPVPEVQQPEREQERGHTWGGMEL
jgi:biotin operon repressor